MHFNFLNITLHSINIRIKKTKTFNIIRVGKSSGLDRVWGCPIPARVNNIVAQSRTTLWIFHMRAELCPTPPEYELFIRAFFAHI